MHLFERECSIQRRHQKVLEETPSTAVTPALRARMGAAAVALATAAGYQNAGTVEFLVEGRGDSAAFYFLEMNARLQVEHPITEAVTGVDLVRAQLERGGRRAAAVDAGGSSTQRGHAIEVRICAEDPRQNFLPQAGVLALYREPSMPGVRVDSGVFEGAEVSVHYDSLLAKLIARGETREAARLRARARARPLSDSRHPHQRAAADAAADARAVRRRRSRHALPRTPRPPRSLARGRRTVGRRARGRRWRSAARPAAALGAHVVDRRSVVVAEEDACLNGRRS